VGVDLPPAFDDWFARATARSPHDRFDSAGEMVADLARVLAASAGSDPMALFAHPHRQGRGRALGTLIAAVAVLGVAGSALRVRASTSAPDPVPSPAATTRVVPEPALTTEHAQAASSVAPPGDAPSIEPQTEGDRRAPAARYAPVRAIPAPAASRALASRRVPSAAPAGVPTVDGPW
jgi:serine/threonine-protein kinase